MGIDTQGPTSSWQRLIIPVTDEMRKTGSPGRRNPTVARRAIYIAKRMLDIVVSAVSPVVLSPFVAVIALAVKCTSAGPISYRWDVIGRNGVPFTGCRFRTMVVNADELKKDLWQYNKRNGRTFKMKSDPRVTPVGRILRKFSLDELRQLWSVLKRDVSLVHSRPIGPQEWEHFEDWQRRKLSISPGMICLSHVRAKPGEFKEWIRLDLEYIDNWSVWLDVKLLFGVALCMLSGSNH